MKFAVVDVETTGGDPKRASITEIGIVLVENGEVTATYQSLVKPLEHIPPTIQTLTGITNEMVADAPEFETIADEVEALLNGAVFVAHHVLFDYRFVKEAFKRAGKTFTANKRLCTARYARKRYPNLGKYSLAKLCTSFGVVNEQPHRALADAEATAHLLIHFLANDHANVYETFFKQRSASLNLPHWLSNERLQTLPECPGIYRFYDKRGKLIYIGKAKNIKKRVRSHFSGDANRVGTALVQMSHTMDVELTGSELMASLHEDHEIRHHWPILNKAQKVNGMKYHIVYYQDREGHTRLGIHRRRQSLHSIKQFYTLYTARNWLIKQVEAYQLDPAKCHVASWSEVLTVTPEAHEKGIEAMLKGIDAVKESYILLLAGRTPGEKGFVWIENDVYKGTGFISEDEQVMRSEDLEPFLTVRKSSPTVWSALEHYRQKTPMANYLQWPEAINP